MELLSRDKEAVQQSPIRLSARRNAAKLIGHKYDGISSTIQYRDGSSQIVIQHARSWPRGKALVNTSKVS
jgi:hypothetical protein